MGSQRPRVAIDPRTGAILALASYPSFNPNALATQDGVKFNKVDKRLVRTRPSRC